MRLRDSPHGRELGRFFEPGLAWANRTLYLLVAFCLLAAAFLVLVYSVVQFATEAGDHFLLAVVFLINDLLLVLIVLEVLGTVRDYLSTGTTSLRVFLYVGIISAIRRIVPIGAETTAGEGVEGTEFTNLMIDLGVHAGVVLALAIALFLFGHQGPISRTELETAQSGPREEPEP